MTVSIERDAHVGMPQSLLHDLGTDPPLKQHCTVDVAQVVEPEVEQSRSSGHLTERVTDSAGVQVSTSE